MAQQKLYTEEQVRLMIEKSRATGLTAEFLTLATPAIELPSDEDEEKSATILSDNIQQHIGFNRGVKWMKEQILNQIK